MLWLCACSCLMLGARHSLVDARRVTWTGQNLLAFAEVSNSSEEGSADPAPPMDLSLERALELHIMSSSAFLDCLLVRESGDELQPRMVEVVKEMWTLDFYLHVLTAKERQELNGLQSWLVNKLQGTGLQIGSWKDRLRELEGKRDVFSRMENFALAGFPGLKKPTDQGQETPAKLASFNGSNEEWEQEWVRQMFTDEPLDYKARSLICHNKLHAQFEDTVTKMQLELQDACDGTARMAEKLSSCSARSDHPCPEGSTCGVVSQKDMKKYLVVAPIMITLVHVIVFGICLLLGSPGAFLLIPGQSEVGLVAASFLARSGHNCACKPQSCTFSESEQHCVLQGASPLHASLPLAGYKCSLEESGKKKPTCKLTACDAADYQAPLTPMPAYHGRQVEGRLGKVDRELFNCWRLQAGESGLQATANFQMSSSDRREFYQERDS